MNNIERLPDCYRKDPEGNNYKLLRLNEQAIYELHQDMEAVKNVLDLNQATGETLELYGDMLAQLRGPLTDEQYRHMILAQIGRNYVKGDYSSIMNALVMMFSAGYEQITEADFELVEDDKPCLVRLKRYPSVLEEEGFSVQQMAQMIKSLLPICITLLLQFYSSYKVPIHYETAIHFQTGFHPRYNLPYLNLDRTWLLDKRRRLNGYDSGDILDFYPVSFRARTGVRAEAETGQRLRLASRTAVTAKTDTIHRVRLRAAQEIKAAEQMHVQTAAEVGTAAGNTIHIVQGVQQELATGTVVHLQTRAAQETKADLRTRVRAEAGYAIDTASYMTKMNQTDAVWTLSGGRRLDGGRYVL